MKRLLNVVVLVAALACAVGLPGRAEASPIVVGDFTWDPITAPNTGPFFEVLNLSTFYSGQAVDFLNVLVTWFYDDGAGGVASGSENLGTVGDFASAITTSDLTQLTILYATLSIGGSSVPGTFFVLPLGTPTTSSTSPALPNDILTTPIEFTPASAPIPEPASLVLVGLGLALAARRLRSRA